MNFDLAAPARAVRVMALLGCAWISAAWAQSAAPAPAQAGTRSTEAAGAAQATASRRDAAQTAGKAEKPRPLTRRQREAAQKAYLAGAKDIEEKDIHAAVRDFSTAAQLDPANAEYTASLQIAEQHLVTQLVQDADKAKLMGQPDVARTRIREALALDPRNEVALQHLGDLVEGELGPSADLSNASMQLAEPIRLEPDLAKLSFHRKSTQQDLIREVLRSYGLSVTIDSSVRSRPARMDVDNVTYEQAARVLCLVTDTFIVPLDPKRVLVAQDTRANRDKFEREAVETLYLPGLEKAELTEVTNIARNLFDIRKAFAEASSNTLTLNGPPAKLRALNETLATLLKGRSQLQLEFRLFEIDKTRAKNIGVVLPQQTTLFNVPSEVNSILANNQDLIQQIISSGLANSGDTAAIALALIESGLVSGTILNQPFRTFGGGLTLTGVTTSGVSENLSIASSDVRTIDEITMRVRDQDTSTVRMGTRYPIITSLYSTPSSGINIPGITSPGLSNTLSSLGLGASSLGGSSSNSIPQIQFEDLGLTLKATPRIQQTREVSMKLDLKIESLGGSTLNGNPILNNKAFVGNVTLKEGESAVVVSSISRSQSNAILGIPGLSELPGFRLPTDANNNYDTTDLIILITPHLVRATHTEPTNRLVMLPR